MSVTILNKMQEFNEQMPFTRTFAEQQLHLGNSGISDLSALGVLRPLPGADFQTPAPTVPVSTRKSPKLYNINTLNHLGARQIYNMVYQTTAITRKIETIN